jgi:hypothetical protein
LRDRCLGWTTLARLALAVALLTLPLLVPTPGADSPAPIAAFVPLAFAVPSALSIPERLEWAGQGRAQRRLRRIRIAASGLSELVAVVAVIAVAAMTKAPAGVVPTALAVEGVTLLVATVASRMAWLVAVAAGSIALLSFAGRGIPVVFLTPAIVGAPILVVGIAVYATFGPRERATG